MIVGKFIAYYRVSTQKQGSSGLGLDAQKKSVNEYLSTSGVISEYTEVESGKRSDRPELAKALEHCKMTGATLVIAKLDRLARNVHFISGLMESGVEFIAVDMPQANKLTVHLMAAMAEYEAEAISQRTKAALKAAKERGARLGSPENLKEHHRANGRLRGAEANKVNADEYAKRTYPIVNAYISQGYSIRETARQLNEIGILTASGKTGAWTATSVSNVMKRVKE